MQSHDFFTRIIAVNALGPNTQEASGEVEEVFLCSQCEEAHDDYDDARNCCRPDVYDRYRCTSCRAVYLREEEAEKCHPFTSTAQPMQCPVCMTCAESYEDAADCCLHTHPNIDAFGRERIAQAVANGTPWPEAVARNVTH